MIKRALISVSDKSGVERLAKELSGAGVEIISTGGTYSLLKNAGIDVIQVSDITGFAECLDGRVKTLHPNIHGGILAIRGNAAHMNQLGELGIQPIDLVVVNLYPFRNTIMKKDVAFEEAVENIDIGGPSMLRAAAKNFKDVLVVCDPQDYGMIIDSIKSNTEIPNDFRLGLAKKVFHQTAYYDSLIDKYLSKFTAEDDFPNELVLSYDKVQDMRYGENPHQGGAFYSEMFDVEGTLADMNQLWGKELSYNNISDANAAIEIVKEYPDMPTAVNVKHANPCAVASSETISDAYQKAYDADPVSIFGGVVSLNRTVDAKTAKLLCETFLEIVIATAFDDDALEILKAKKNLRLIQINNLDRYSYAYETKKVLGGLLIQKRDEKLFEELKVVTEKSPTDSELRDLIFAYKAVKNTKSNAISLCKDLVLIGNGPGQTNRIGALKIALEQAGEKARGSVLASDAFFPFDDCVEAAAKAGISAIIQPGGAGRDEDSIKKCNEYGISMIFCGIRHFKH